MTTTTKLSAIALLAVLPATLAIIQGEPAAPEYAASYAAVSIASLRTCGAVAIDPTHVVTGAHVRVYSCLSPIRTRSRTNLRPPPSRHPHAIGPPPSTVPQHRRHRLCRHRKLSRPPQRRPWERDARKRRPGTRRLHLTDHSAPPHPTPHAPSVVLLLIALLLTADRLRERHHRPPRLQVRPRHGLHHERRCRDRPRGQTGQQRRSIRRDLARRPVARRRRR